MKALLPLLALSGCVLIPKEIHLTGGLGDGSIGRHVVDHEWSYVGLTLVYLPEEIFSYGHELPSEQGVPVGGLCYVDDLSEADLSGEGAFLELGTPERDGKPSGMEDPLPPVRARVWYENEAFLSWLERVLLLLLGAGGFVGVKAARDRVSKRPAA